MSKKNETHDGSVRYIIEYEKDSDIRKDVFNAMARIGCPILDMQSGNETLEDMFLKLTSGSASGKKGGK